MVRARVLSALAGIPLVALVVWVGGLPFTLAVLALALLGLWELMRAMRRMGKEVAKEVAIAGVIAVVLSAHQWHDQPLTLMGAWAFLWWATVLGSMGAFVFRSVRAPATLPLGDRLFGVAATVFCIGYLSLFAFLVLLRHFFVSVTDRLYPLWESATLSAFVAWLSALVWTKWRFGKTDPSFAFTAFWAGLIAGLAVGGVSFLPVAFVGLVTGALAISFSLTLDRHFVDDPVGIVAAEGIAPLVGLVGQWLWRERLFGVGLVSWLISFGLGLLAVWLTGKLLASLGLLRPLPMDEFVGLDQRLYGITAYPEFEMREA